jgi:hypothetical protein
MFRTRATVLTQDFAPRTAATHVSHARPTDLRLRWTARDGALTQAVKTEYIRRYLTWL